MSDIIDTLAGITPGSELDTLRRQRPQARQNAQRSFTVLLEPDDDGTFSVAQRYAVAAYTVGLQASGSQACQFYLELLSEESGDHGEELASAVAAAAEQARRPGPYGSYREPRHTAESEPGQTVRYDPDALPAVISPRLAVALEHAHLLSLHPRDARPEHLGRLEAAGWSADDIVTLSQLISFLSFQIRVVDGLRALAGLPAAAGTPPSSGAAATASERAARAPETQTATRPAGARAGAAADSATGVAADSAILDYPPAGSARGLHPGEAGLGAVAEACARGGAHRGPARGIDRPVPDQQPLLPPAGAQP